MSTLLVVDDSEANRCLLQTLLTRNGYEVVLAADGTEALDKAHENPPDLIITDILMPGMDGYALCREWKRDEKLKTIPFVFYTSTYTDPKDRQLALDMGAERFIVKPVEQQVFLERIMEVIDGHKAGRLPPPHEPVQEETVYLKEYSAALVRKLEDKVVELESARVSLNRELTERKQAAEKAERAGHNLAASETRYRRLFETAKDGILILDADTGEIVDVNPFLSQLLGFDHAHFLGKKVWEIGVFKDIAASETAFLELQTNGYIRYDDLPLETRDGRRIAAEFVSNVYLADSARVIQCNIRDVTDRNRAEEALILRARIDTTFLTATDDEMFNELLKVVLEVMHSPFGVFGYIDEDGAVVIPTLTRGVWDKCQVPGKTIRFPQETWGDNTWIQSIRERRTIHSNAPSIRIPEGHVGIQRHVSTPVLLQGELIGLLMVANKETDYTEADLLLLDAIAAHVAPALKERLHRRQAVETLRKSEERHRTILQTAMDGFWVVDTQGRLLEINEAYCRMSGYGEQELLAMHIPDLEVNETEDIATAHFQKTIARGEDRFESRHRRKDGTILHVEVAVQHKAEDGGRFVAFLHDITERKQAEETKAGLESQLRQAQKMESVGRLAGGVAHDFNNMLAVILGYTDLALDRVNPGQPLHGDLEEVHKAGERAADLTRQLLTFARKQAVMPVVLDLNEAVAGMLKMLQRLIGEDIQIRWCPGADLWPVRMDPSQIDQILANLCVNARDAIADVGKITIGTENRTVDEHYCAGHAGFAPGEYVLLAVSDNGCGMDRATADKIFEPFFTTKELGRGTGLGLATVYGIAKQNNGFINVYSEVGQGTAFTIYLPRHAGGTGQTVTRNAASANKRGHGTILLVEDEPAFLKLAVKMLEHQGYTVLAAGTPGEALRLAKEHGGKIHLLMTDVIMPEMNGHDLAQNVLSLYPQIKNLYMSGYTADVIAHHGVLEEGTCFIQKPFSMDELAAKVREALESPGRPTAGPES